MRDNDNYEDHHNSEDDTMDRLTYATHITWMLAGVIVSHQIVRGGNLNMLVDFSALLSACIIFLLLPEMYVIATFIYLHMKLALEDLYSRFIDR